MLKRDSVNTKGVRAEFGLDYPTLDVLKEELLVSHPEIREVDGHGLSGEERQRDGLSYSLSADRPDPLRATRHPI